MIYDVIIIGGGPAGIFAATQLASKSNLTVAILEKAKRLNDARNVGIAWLGGSARSAVKIFSDSDLGGKYADSATFDTFLEEFSLHYSGKIKFKQDSASKKLLKLLNLHDVDVHFPNVAHLTEDKMIKAGDALYNTLKKNINVIHKINITNITKTPECFEIKTDDVNYRARTVIIATGRGHQRWFEKLDKNFNLNYTMEDFWLGYRLEMPLSMYQRTFGKTEDFCMSFENFKTTMPIMTSSIETEECGHLKIANGRSCSNGKKNSVSFALLKHFFTKRSAHYEINRLVEMANVLCDGQLVREPLSKFLDDSAILSPIPEFASLKSGLERLTEIIPGLENKCTVFAPEARLNVLKYKLNPVMESTIPNLYVVGDVSGHTTSFIQAACSGIKAADDIISKKRKRKHGTEGSETTQTQEDSTSV